MNFKTCLKNEFKIDEEKLIPELVYKEGLNY